MEQAVQPTAYPKVNALIQALLAGVQSVIRDQFVGLYLSGSLAGGDFDPLRSDIDFVVVTADELPGTMFHDLEAMHTALNTCGYEMSAQLEGIYLPLAALRRYDPQLAWHPSLSVGGVFGMDGQGSDSIIQRWSLREKGLVVAGPDIRGLIDLITPDDLRQAARATLREWWAPMLANPIRLHTREYQAYAVLTMCRIRCTLTHGLVASKPAAARWAMQTLNGGWIPLITRALHWERKDGVDDIRATLDFIRDTMNCGL